MERDNGGKREGFSGTTIKDTWTKPRADGSKGGRWGRLRWLEVVGGKWRQLYLNNNKIKINKYIVLKKGIKQEESQLYLIVI